MPSQGGGGVEAVFEAFFVARPSPFLIFFQNMHIFVSNSNTIKEFNIRKADKLRICKTEYEKNMTISMDESLR
jgi:hypothetical protein